jgi:Tol biopolymer transport system component/DNA-binding winged helix-turn-helix (wHTH) protein
MDTVSGRSRKLCFGVFQLDLQTGDLTKRGVRIRLQGQPLSVLMMLLERPGELVTRDELQQQLWGDGTIVDFDHGLSTTINKIRDRLGDSAENPRFIETIARRGYRFVAPVQELAPEEAASTTTSEVQTLASAASRLKSLVGHRRSWIYGGVAAGVIAFLAAGLYWVWSAPRPPMAMRQITWSGHVFPGDMPMESFPGLATDGTRVYFDEVHEGRFVLAFSLPNDYETHLLATNSEIAGPTLIEISSNGTQLMVRNHLAPEVEQPLWIIATSGSSARRVPEVLAHDATWMPGGDSILYASGDELWIADEHGSKTKFASLSGRAFWLRWSPDGKQLRFTMIDPRTRTPFLWEIGASGGKAHPLLPDWNPANGECCGSWTPDGKDYLFQAAHDGQDNIWALPESGLRRWLVHRPFQVTNGPLSFSSPIVSGDSRHLLFIGTHSRSRLFRYDAHSHQILSYLPELTGATHVAFTQDGKKVAWISNNEGTLWSSLLDGSQRIQLTSVPIQIYMMTWSPDGTKLAFMGKEAGTPWKIYTVSEAGAGATMLLTENRGEADPTWSPDGRFIAFGRPTAYMAEDTADKAISVVDTKSGTILELPGSKGLFSPRWSPNGQYLAAITLDQRKLRICNMSNKQWTEVPTASIGNPVWSSDSRSIYYHSFMERDLPIYKLDVQTHKQEKIFQLGDLQVSDAADYSFQGVSPDGSPILSVHLWSADVYQIAWRHP